jgi:hypothetical protein
MSVDCPIGLYFLQNSSRLNLNGFVPRVKLSHEIVNEIILILIREIFWRRWWWW